MSDLRSPESPAASRALHAALLDARCALGLAFLARVDVQRREEASRAGKSHFQGTVQELADALSAAARDLRQAGVSLEAGDARLAERLTRSATARALAAVDVSSPSWRHHVAAPVPQGGIRPEDDLALLALVAEGGELELGAASPRHRRREPAHRRREAA